MEVFCQELEKGKWRTGGQTYKWLQKKYDVSLRPNNIYKYLKKPADSNS